IMGWPPLPIHTSGSARVTSTSPCPASTSSPRTGGSPTTSVPVSAPFMLRISTSSAVATGNGSRSPRRGGRDGGRAGGVGGARRGARGDVGGGGGPQPGQREPDGGGTGGDEPRGQGETAEKPGAGGRPRPRDGVALQAGEGLIPGRLGRLRRAGRLPEAGQAA